MLYVYPFHSCLARGTWECLPPAQRLHPGLARSDPRRFLLHSRQRLGAVGSSSVLRSVRAGWARWWKARRWANIWRSTVAGRCLPPQHGKPGDQLRGEVHPSGLSGRGLGAVLRRRTLRRLGGGLSGEQHPLLRQLPDDVLAPGRRVVPQADAGSSPKKWWASRTAAQQLAAGDATQLQAVSLCAVFEVALAQTRAPNGPTIPQTPSHMAKCQRPRKAVPNRAPPYCERFGYVRRGGSGGKSHIKRKRATSYRHNPLKFLEPARRLELRTC